MKSIKSLLILFVLLISVLSITGLIIGLQNKNKMSVGSKAADETSLAVKPNSDYRLVASCDKVECEKNQNGVCNCYALGWASPTPEPPDRPTPTLRPCPDGTCLSKVTCVKKPSNGKLIASWELFQNVDRYALRIARKSSNQFECGKNGNICIDDIRPLTDSRYQYPGYPLFGYYEYQIPNFSDEYRIWVHAINSQGIWGEAIGEECPVVDF